MDLQLGLTRGEFYFHSRSVVVAVLAGNKGTLSVFCTILLSSLLD